MRTESGEEIFSQADYKIQASARCRPAETKIVLVQGLYWGWAPWGIFVSDSKLGSRWYCYSRDVRLSVRPSVTHWYCIKLSK